MEPQNLNTRPNHQPQTTRPPAEGTWIERRIVGFLKSRIAPPVPQNNNNNNNNVDIEGLEAVDQTNQLKTFFSEVTDLIYDEIKKGYPEKEFVITELKQELTDCLNHLFMVIFKKLTENDSNLKINGADILPETQAVRFIENLLILVQKHLSSLEDDSDEQTIKQAFRAMGSELLETAFPGKQADKNLPSLLQSILGGSWFYSWATNGATSQLTWDGLINIFADFGSQLYSSKLKKKLNDDDLEEYKGVSQLAKDLAKLAIDGARELKKIPVELKGLNEGSAAFLNQIFVKLLKGNQDDDSENIVNQTWLWLEGTLENTISGILCIIFKPNAGQTVEERYHQFVESMAEQALGKVPEWDLWTEKIEQLLSQDDNSSKTPRKKLENILKKLELLEIQRIKNSKNPNHSPVIKQIDIHSSLQDILEIDLAQNIKTLKLLLKDNIDCIEPAEIFLKQRCYSFFARELFQEELHAQELKGCLNLPEFISSEKLFTLLYDNIGNLLEEFHQHHKDITERSIRCEEKLAEWNLPGLGNLLKKALVDLTQILEEKAENQEEKLIEQYDFLNNIVCHLLKKTEEGEANQDAGIAGVKKEALAFIEKVMKIIIVEEIDQNIGEGTVEGAIKTVSDNIMAKATVAMKNIDTKLALEEADNETLFGIIEEIYEEVRSNEQLPEFGQFDLGEKSIEILAELFTLDDQLENEEIEQAIQQKVIADAKEFLRTHPEIPLEDFKKQLVIDWKIKKETKVIVGTILPEDDFNGLLPPTFKDKGIWNLVCEKLLSPYLYGIYNQKQIIASLDNDGAQQKLKEPVLDNLVNEYLPKIKQKILELRTHIPELDKMLNGVMIDNGPLSGLFDQIAGPIFKSILAFHVNPKDGKSSQQLTAELFWEIITVAWNSFEQAKQDPDNASKILKTASETIANRLIPQDLWDRHVSGYFKNLLNRETMVGLIHKTLIKGHADYLRLHSLGAKGNENLKAKAKKLEIPSFLSAQVQKILATQQPGKPPRVFHPNPWINETVCQVLQRNEHSEMKPLNQLIESLLFSISDYLIIHAMNDKSLNNDLNILDNLEEKLGNIAKIAKPLLDWINSKEGKDCISPRIKQRHIKEYLKITGKEKLCKEDYPELTYWTLAKKSLSILLPDEIWNELVPETIRNFLTKDTVAGFMVPFLESIHELRRNLQGSAAEIEESIDDYDQTSEDTLNKFLSEVIIANVREVAEGIGSDEDDLKTVPPFARTLLIKLLSTKNAGIKDFRNRLIKQAVYVIVDQLMGRDNPNSAGKVFGLIHACINKYQDKKSDLEIATLLLDSALPVDLWMEMIPELLRDFIDRESLIEAVVPYIAQVREKINLFDKKKQDAIRFFDNIDPKHGIHPLLAQAFYSLDAMIDEYANQEDKIAPNQPELVNDLIKQAFGDDQTAPMIKESIRSLVFIALHESLKENENDPDQTFNERVFELVGKLTATFKTDKPSMAKLLQVFIPEKLRKEILPLFLHKSFSYEKIVEWFFEEDSKQIEGIKLNLNDYEDIKLDDNFERLSTWLKDQLASQNMFKDLIFEDDEIHPDVGRFLDITFNEISQEDHVQALLGTKFLPYAFNEAFTNVDGVELPEGDFNKLAGEKFMSALLPNGKDNLPLPEMAQKALASGIGGIVGSVTNRNERLVFINKFLAPKNDPAAANKIAGLEAQIDKINPPAQFNEASFLKDSGIQFKKNLVKFAKDKVDEYVEQKPWPKFFKWFAKVFIKAIVSLVMNISLKHRLWKFISDPNNDELIKKMIWKFLDTMETYEDEEVDSKRLAQTLQNTFKEKALVPTTFLRKMAAGAIGEYLAGTDKVPGKNFVDLIASPAA